LRFQNGRQGERLGVSPPCAPLAAEYDLTNAKNL